MCALGLLTFVGCKSTEPDAAQEDVSAVSTENGSWGNGSWGNGSWGNGSWGNGTWGNGTWGNGTWGNGTWGNGSWGNGTWGNGTWGNGSWGNGTWGNGTWGNGTWGNGSWGNGSWGNGSWGNGTWGNGMLLDTLAVSALDISSLVDTSLSNAACESGVDRSAAFTELMVYVATIRCALPSPCAENDTECMSQLDCASDPDCRIIVDCDGHELYVSGRDGLGTDQSDPAVVASVDACIDSTLADLNNDFRAYADNLNHYAVSCALPASSGGDCSTDPGCVEVTYQLYPNGTETKQYYGGIGLAPTWKNNPNFDLDPIGQRRVSACLASRTNPHQKKVQLSIRGIGIPTTATERYIYSQHEGAFWGNLFSNPPEIYACTAEGASISGRLCSGGEACGFIDAGSCDDVCTTKDAEGAYSGCGPNQDNEVLNTFLPLARNLASGRDHTCGKSIGGTVSCWGLNNHGQLGDGTTIDSTVAQWIAGLDNVDQISAGYRHTCARKFNGDLYCFGLNSQGQIGNGIIGGNQLSPVTVLSDVAQVSAGNYHTCAVLTNGRVQCWGKNASAELGTGTTENSSTPVDVVGLTNITKVMARSSNSCALENDGTLWCWGRNVNGQLGRGTLTSYEADIQSPTLPEPVLDFCLGNAFGCALLESEDLWCWGTSWGMVEPEPADFAPSVVKSIACGDNHACALARDGSVWCAGSDNSAELGDLAGAALSIPGTTARIMAGSHSTCSVQTDGSLYCWGSNDFGQLGLGHTSEVSGFQRTTLFDQPGDGVCEFAETSEVSNECVCTPQCTGLECGADGCGGSCGSCSEGTICEFGECLPSLVAHYTFDDGTASDSSGHGHDGTVVGGQVVNGNFGQALHLDGENDRVELGDIELGTRAITLSAWFRTNDLENQAEDFRIISKAIGVNEQDHYWMISTVLVSGVKRLRFRLKTRGHTSTLKASTGDLQENQWHHVAATYDGSEMKLYLDGSVVASQPKTGIISCRAGTETWIGDNPPTGSRAFQGEIDDVQLYRVALSPEEIAEISSQGNAGSCEPSCSGLQCGGDGCGGSCGSCASGEVCDDGQCGVCVPSCSGLECGSDGCGGSCGQCGSGEECSVGQCTAGPIAHWTFEDDLSHGQVADIAGNGHSGTVHGAQAATGPFGSQALEFDGVDDHVDLGPFDVNANALTISLWFRADSLANCTHRDCRLISKAVGTASQDHYWMISTVKANLLQTGLRFRLKTNGATQTLLSNSVGYVEPNAWYHVVARYDGTQMKLFVNGKSAASRSATGPIDTNATVSAFIGDNPGPGERPWDGSIDSVRIYDRALTNAEVVDLYTREQNIASQ